ncbi:MAG TPA: hypothetical protein VLH15_09390 [Dehalococcoidales bacterium]|nr:hypothetical protein [Dehalococcoidales bacterium]
MPQKEGYIGKLSITWEDGERTTFEIAQTREHIWIDDHFVSVRNEKSWQGLLREISEVMTYPPKKIRQHNWLELVGQLKYPK